MQRHRSSRKTRYFVALQLYGNASVLPENYWKEPKGLHCQSIDMAIQRRRRRLCMARHGYTGTTAIRLDVRNVSSLVYVTLVQSTSTTSVAAATYRRQAEDRQTDGRTNERMDRQSDRQTYGWMDGWLALAGRTDIYIVHEHTSMCYSK